ncbi:hypothetical protein GF338_09175 [candidate division WOR-3 bacterium]|nr:hypothetical protein [candidate division WOR-3 bacterium]
MADLEKNHGISSADIQKAIRQILNPRNESLFKRLPHRWSRDYSPDDPFSGKALLPSIDINSGKPVVETRNWRELYFHYPRGKNTAEFKTMGRDEKFNTVASYYPDPVWWPKKGVVRPRWSDWFDVALIELTTGIRVSYRRSAQPKEPICQSDVRYYQTKGKRIPLIEAVRLLSWVKRYKGRYMRSNVRKTHNGVKVPWKGKNPKALWVFGHLSRNTKTTVFSLMLQADPKQPIAFFRAIREYKSSYRKPWDISQIYHDYLLELMALHLFYDDKSKYFSHTLREVFTVGIVPIALFKTGKLYPVRYEDRIRKSEKIFLKGLGLR